MQSSNRHLYYVGKNTSHNQKAIEGILNNSLFRITNLLEPSEYKTGYLFEH